MIETAIFTEREREFSIQTRDLTFGAKRWGQKDGLPVLALHGWLDNAATFDRLAPCLPELQIVSVDLAGHGHSGHRPPGVRYHFIDNIDDVVAMAGALGWDQFALMGHSMGGGISSLIAGSFPERVTHLILLEGLGPMTREAETARDALSLSVNQMQQRGEKKTPVYPDFDTAVAARTTVGDMQLDSVRILVRRNLTEVNGGVMWRSDPRLKMGSALYLVEEQVHGFLRGITAPTLLVTGENGLLKRLGKLNDRIACVSNIQHTNLSGGHHLHLDDPKPVAEVIRHFLSC